MFFTTLLRYLPNGGPAAAMLGDPHEEVVPLRRAALLSSLAVPPRAHKSLVEADVVADARELA